MLPHLNAWAHFKALMSTPPIGGTEHFALHRVALANIPTQLVQIQTPQRLEIAALLPKRNAKDAVTRNTLRRLVYVAFEKQQSQLQSLPHLVRLKKPLDRKKFISSTSEFFKANIALELQLLFARAAQ